MATTAMDDALREFLGVRWWTLALRGLFGIVFGIICFTSPAIAGASLYIVFGVFAIADGIVGLIGSAGKARRGERWAWLAVEAVASLVIGILLFTMPALSLVVLYFIIAVKAAITGVALLIGSIKLDGEHGQGFMAAAGAFSLILAVLLFVSPLLGLKIVIWWIGAWAIAFGILLVILGFKLRSARQRLGGLTN
jgi:uncharacterized membrane protein HdeD (DUF308 family)